MNTVNASEEWRVQALRDLDAAKHLASGGFHEWAAYASQQAAEKAIKAVRYAMAIDLHTFDDKKKEDRSKRALTHNLLLLAEPLVELWPAMVPGRDELSVLSNHEADGRYPGVRAGAYQAPMRTYDAKTVEEALSVAEGIVRRCTELVAEIQAFWVARQT